MLNDEEFNEAIDGSKNRFGEPIRHEPSAEKLKNPEIYDLGGREFQKWEARLSAKWDQFKAHLKNQGAKKDRAIETAIMKNMVNHVGDYEPVETEEELQIVRHKDKWGNDRPDLDILRSREKKGGVNGVNGVNLLKFKAMKMFKD